jgi:hypothetical protein
MLEKIKRIERCIDRNSIHNHRFYLNATFKRVHVVTTQTVSCDVEAVNVECELNYEMAVK